MKKDFCKQCDRTLYNRYGGFCSSACCIEFSIKHNILFIDAMSSYGDQEIERLEDEIARSECNYSGVVGEYGDMERMFDKADIKINSLKEKVEELKNIDWEVVEKERFEEVKFNESLFAKMDNIKVERDGIKEENKKVKVENKKVKVENILIHEQNLDLLKTIKDLKSHSDRFKLLDLGIELDYDE